MWRSPLREVEPHCQNMEFNSPNSSVRRSPAHGPSGETEAWLMVKLAADRKQGDLSMLLKSGADPNVVVAVEWRDFDGKNWEPELCFPDFLRPSLTT